MRLIRVRFRLRLLVVGLLLTSVVTQRGYADQTPPPTKVVLAGTLQSELGCSSDWQPDCDKTALAYDAQSDVWTGTFAVTPGNDQDGQGSRYKAVLNGSWNENYGAKAQAGGADIPLVVTAPTKVKFYYDHKSHWATDNVNSKIVVAIGNFQRKLGCQQDNDPTCLQAWLQDPSGAGVYSFVTTHLPAGSYEVKMALNESLAEVYGQDNQKGGDAIPFTVKKDGDEVYFGFDPKTQTIALSTEGAPRGSLAVQQAIWVNRDTLVWNTVGSPKYAYELHYDSAGALQLGPRGIEGGQVISLTFTSAGPGDVVLQKNPYLAGFSAFKLSPADLAKIPDIVKGQIAVTARDKDGKLIDATGVQIPGVLDDLYTYAGPLGVTFENGVPTIRVWAPTARSVQLQLFDDSKTDKATLVPLQGDPKSGVWSVTGDARWKGKYYLFEVEVYVAATGKVEKNLVTDPYSLSLSMNSTRSQIVDLEDQTLLPANWKDVQKPPLASPTDIVVYELHVRDFSAGDQTVPENERGTFKAFTELNSNGMQHLKQLAAAGLTHVHLLPAFDIATIEEDKTQWQLPDAAKLKALPGDSDQQQALIAPLVDKDGFNWGYDPYHYTVPEGSYSTNPDGPARIVEFRQMVQSLSQIGLRTVMDVVYNHTNASGQNPRSVLDEIVPGYYYRLDLKGQVETSTCCQNTATEHAMMEKLMIDSVVTWAKEYKVDGFRFDLMGHHMLDNMVQVRQALDALTLDKDGVDGKQIYIYGEGWDFGEVANNARGKNATQLNIGGTGIGVFNDRLRDAARGGGPFAPLPEQGFVTGLYETPNAYEKRTSGDQRSRLLEYTDWIRIGLAGNLRDFKFEAARGEVVTAENVKYSDKPAAYTLLPQENVNYVSAHDNETIFDAVQAKAPTTTLLADRIRMNNLALDLVMLGQGVPFFHAGDELLRSKSLDRNSYNSGDWFNTLDFTYQSDNWAVGLPLAGDNKDKWPIIQPLLADPKLKPQKADMLGALAHFEEMLKIRKSSKLFRLDTAEAVQQHLSFLNTGPQQIPDLIVMRLSNSGTKPISDAFGEIVVLFNSSSKAQSFTADVLKNLPFELHPTQAASIDAALKAAQFDRASGTFTVPARTTTVFVVKADQLPVPTAAPVLTATQPPTAVPTVPPAVVPTVPLTLVPVPTAPQNGTSSLPIVLVVVVAAAIVGSIFFRRRAPK